MQVLHQHLLFRFHLTRGGPIHKVRWTGVFIVKLQEDKYGKFNMTLLWAGKQHFTRESVGRSTQYWPLTEAGIAMSSWFVRLGAE
jgi:hypothetical protein